MMLFIFSTFGDKYNFTFLYIQIFRYFDVIIPRAASLILAGINKNKAFSLLCLSAKYLTETFKDTYIKTLIQSNPLTFVAQKHAIYINKKNHNLGSK